MAAIPFVPPLEVRYGEAEQVSPLIRRVVAENPSMFTYRGTGTYIIGSGEVAVVDPGPELESHQAALAAALEGERVTHILVTHCHADHSPLARWLADETGATTFAFGPHGAIDPERRRGDRGGRRHRVRPRRQARSRRGGRGLGLDRGGRAHAGAHVQPHVPTRWPRSGRCSRVIT